MNEYNIYVGVQNAEGVGQLRRVSCAVKWEDLSARLAVVRNLYADAAVHVAEITEKPFASYLPKCVEAGNCKVLTDEIISQC